MAREEDGYGALDDDELEGLYWRWAESAVPIPARDGWVLPVTDGRIARLTVQRGQRQLSVQEWIYECFCAHFEEEIFIDRTVSPNHHLPAGGPAAASIVLLELIGSPLKEATLSKDGDLRLALEDGGTIRGRIAHVHCDDARWEISPSDGTWELWAE